MHFHKPSYPFLPSFPKTLKKAWWGKNSEDYTSPIYSSDVIEAQTMSMSKDPQNSKTQGRRLASSSPIQPSQVIDPRASANAANPHRSIEKVNLENIIIAENTENLNLFARVICTSDCDDQAQPTAKLKKFL
ncbi:hypothetical protein PGT21_028145 [Puccinia graminis f. sp. tritici]|uniref:Uncharacterized protein n=1 Tax=Puccinia graminis f. sp. tritici TaxID=56615 RepID=A0A5B0NPK1_PUCGR|nr:hypothetical protein PGT21_028145 [Puccinia graminis f. sp. tritici]